MTVERTEKMCQRTGCTETWMATSKSRKRYCRDCIPQSSSGPKYPFRMQKSCTCGAKEILKIHNEQERISPFVCKECTKASVDYKWHEMQLLYLVMLNQGTGPVQLVRHGVFKDWDEYVLFRQFLLETMQIDLNYPIKDSVGWQWGSLADGGGTVSRYEPPAKKPVSKKRGPYKKTGSKAPQNDRDYPTNTDFLDKLISKIKIQKE